MPTHFWGDKDFDFDALDKAQNFIYFWSKYLARLRIITKEKYGTIRYEFIYMWGFSHKPIIHKLQWRLFLFIVTVSMLRYFKVRYEIVDDLLCQLEQGKAPRLWKCLIHSKF